MRYLALLALLLIGEYVPQFDDNNNLLARQCWASTGTCWCHYTPDKTPFRYGDPRDCPSKK